MLDGSADDRGFGVEWMFLFDEEGESSELSDSLTDSSMDYSD